MDQYVKFPMMENSLQRFIDVRKFRSSMTLFDLVSPGDLFGEALDVFFNGDRDARTLALF